MDMSQTMSTAWHVSPLWIAGLLLLVVEEAGLARLLPRLSPDRARRWRRRGIAWDLLVVGLCLLDSSPLEGLSMEHLWLHMLIHVVEMFYVPAAMVLCAPWLPALFALRASSRRRLLRAWQLGRARWLTRRVTRLLRSPLVGLIAFNVVMVLWHLPVAMDAAGRSPELRSLAMTGSFLVGGWMFWRIILPSGPYRERGSLGQQALSVAATSIVMLALALAMAVMSRGAWYQMNVSMLGPGAALRDQQLAAGILWVCGDFWAAPAAVLIARRAMARPGGIGGAIERSLGRAA